MRVNLLRDIGTSGPCRLLALERAAADAGFSDIVFSGFSGIVFSQESRRAAYERIGMSRSKPAASYNAWRARTFYPPPAGIPLPRRIVRRTPACRKGYDIIRKGPR